MYKGSCFPLINICIFLVTVILLFSTLINIYVFLMIVTLIGLKWDLNVILICLSLMVNISFMYLLVICASSLRNICSIYCPFFSLFSCCLGFFYFYNYVNIILFMPWSRKKQRFIWALALPLCKCVQN